MNGAHDIKKQSMDSQRLASLIGVVVGYLSWGVIQGIQRFPTQIEVVVFVGLFLLVGEALVFSIIFYFEELLLNRSRWKTINGFFNGVVVTYAAFSVVSSLLNHTSPLLI
jgi:hypothetical protein